MFNESTIVTPPAELPPVNAWVQFERLPKWGWEKIRISALVLEYNSDRSRVRVGYLVGGQKFNHWIDRDQIMYVYQPAAETALFGAVSA